MNQEIRYYQQGDVLIKETAKATGRAVKTKVLKSGSNQHTLTKGTFTLKKDEEKMFLIAKTKVTLSHQEHKPIEIAKGTYIIEAVKEYDHMLEESREVVD